MTFHMGKAIVLLSEQFCLPISADKGGPTVCEFG